ncbi:hypothetical protein MesoLj113b_15550 [Mesorhizobium sp. 113-3-3]|nr:hypothetical protein MesoLj113b_15550 [Mesorhizobium sp. 113-3-3]
MTFIALVLVDQVHDVDQAGVRIVGDQRFFRRRQLVLGHALERVEQAHLQAMDALEIVGVLARAAGIHDVLVARQHVRHAARQHAAGAEQVDLEHQRRAVLLLVEQIL